MLKCCGSLCRVSLTSLWTICMQSPLFSGGSRTISQTGATAALSPLMLVAQNGTEIECPVHREGYVRVNRWQCENPAVNTWSTGSKSVAVCQPWQSHTKGSQVNYACSALWATGKAIYRFPLLLSLMNTKLTSTYSLSHCNMNKVNKNVMKKIFSRKQRITCNQLPVRHSDNACNAQLLCLGSLTAVCDWLQFSPVKACILCRRLIQIEALMGLFKESNKLASCF